MSAILEPSRRHRATTGSQVIPRATILDPADHHRSRIGVHVVPRATDLHPALDHRATARGQVIPGRTIVDPTGHHHPTGTHKVPGLTVLHPADRHRTTTGHQVIPGATILHPAAHLSTRSVVVEPRTALTHPTSTHVTTRIKAIHRVTNPHRLASRIGTIRIPVPPADRVAHPLTTQRRGLGSRRRVRCRRRRRVRFVGFPEQQNGGTDPVRSITRVDAQANAHTGRSHSHVHRCGVHPVTLRHVTPVLQDRLPALCVDLHNTHLASLRYASRYRNRHGGGYSRLRVHLESVMHCDDANAGQRYRRRRVGMQVLASNSSLLHCVTDARPQLRSFRSCKIDLGICLPLEVVRANNLEVCDARRQDHDARHRTTERDARHSFPKENTLPVLRIPITIEVKSCVYASTHDDVSRHVSPRI